jgi:hypothetical protein
VEKKERDLDLLLRFHMLRNEDYRLEVGKDARIVSCSRCILMRGALSYYHGTGIGNKIGIWIFMRMAQEWGENIHI